MTKEIINVGLYGGKGIFGGRETPLEASVISCDRSESCSYFKSGHCLNVRSFGGGCEFGSVSTHKGYTSRAKKYHQFRNKWRDHEEYGKLKSPPKKLGLIDDIVVFPYPFIRIKELDDGSLGIGHPSFGSDRAFVDYDKFTVELIHRICTFRPQAMMGGEITSHQKETVPLFLAHLKEVLPERYKEFTDKYDEFTEVDYVGRKALLKTIKPSDVFYEAARHPRLNSEWHWDGELLTYKKGYVSSFSITEDYEIEEIKLKPNDKSVVEIWSNNQVSESTIFVD